MAHDDQFTALGPPSSGSGFPFSAFSTSATGMEYGVNAQGGRCGVYGESVNFESGRESDVARSSEYMASARISGCLATATGALPGSSANTTDDVA